MTDSQLQQIIDFCRPYYDATGRWHGWDHIAAVQKLAGAIADAEFPDTNRRCLMAAATIHDMGRTVKDEGHAEESGRIAEPFLQSIGVSEDEIRIIIDAVVHHDVKNIERSKTIEARIVYDADKIEILSSYGFLRVAFWLVEERKMGLGEAVRFLDEYCERFEATLYSDFAKKLIAKDRTLIHELLTNFNAYEKKWRS